MTNPRLLEFADSTAALFFGSAVRIDGPKALLSTESYAEEMSLCPEEPFYDQRTGAFCSGSLVGPDLLMTAGHCVKTETSCKSAKFVFGFAVREKGVNPESVPAGEVYGCGKLLGREQVGAGADWALIKLDRPVLDHKPLALNRSGKIENGAPLFVIGHPAGLPTKIAGGAKVRDASPNGYFVANLDTYGGNSGSAVFNAGTGLVEGILVRGEDVTKVSALSSSIPATVPEALRTVRINKAFLELSETASR
ncbi:MAG: trypsin-like peptidase domain-containing protein [Elusimicrobia bacterium]|nr:trypsin-like peptidase domain-containing protein [Elusimicrobiota bacterium]